MQDDDVQLEIGGTLQQRISSCLSALDKLLKQDDPIVSSIVVAEKKAGGSGCGNIVDAVAQIMGKMIWHNFNFFFLHVLLVMISCAHLYS